MAKNILLLILFALASVCADAQTQAARQSIRRGNRQFRAEKYDKSQAEYMKAMEADANNPQAVYNLGCAYMLQQNDSAAVANFNKATKMETDKHRRSMAYHNIGVIFQNRTKYDEAISAYKESLRLNPSDNETRYNLALCQKLRKNQPQNKNNQNQNKNDKNKDKNKQQQDQKQDKNKQQQQQQNHQQMSKENAEQLLQAAMQEEKNTRRKVEQGKSRTRNLQKNW